MINKIANFSWKFISWKKFREKVYLVQTQIFNYIKYKQFKKALLYQEFLLFSFEICYISVKQITQLRLDRKIPGVDNKSINNFCQRNELYSKIKKNLYRWNSSQIKQVYLVDFLKGNNLIFVPTIPDRIVQHIWSLVLEPVFNSLFFENQVSLSTINKFLFVKYSVILTFLTKDHGSKYSFIHFKFQFSSFFTHKFSKIHFLKLLVFPEKYKRQIVNSFKVNILNLRSINENLHFYLHTFHYFLIFFGMWSLKHIFLKNLYSKAKFLSNELLINLYYFKEILFFFKKDKNQRFNLSLVRNLILENKILITIFKITDENLKLGIDFLDWHFILLNNYNYKIVPCNTKWLEDKRKFKYLLRDSKFNTYQRIKLVEIFVQTRFFTNWFCSFLFMKKQRYLLKLYLNTKITKYFRFLKYEKNYISKKMFRAF
jgi:hypothetical protein